MDTDHLNAEFKMQNEEPRNPPSLKLRRGKRDFLTGGNGGNREGSFL